MNSIVLFTKKDEWQPNVWVASMGGTTSEGCQFSIEISESWIKIYRYDEVFRDYDDDEEKFVKSLIQDPACYLIEWKGDNFLERFLDDFPENKKGIIDNDHGLICSISELKGIPISKWLREKRAL